MEERETSQPVEELKNVESSLIKLTADVEKLNRSKADALSNMQDLRERIKQKGADTTVHRLLALLESLKALEKQESDVQSRCDENCSKLQAEVNELEELMLSNNDEDSFSKGFNHSFGEAIERLNAAKTELATKLRAIVSLKRQLDDVPSQAELIQYERRFSELYVHIQGKLRQTRKYYATFNALLEIKDLMLKETSLLNSINSQFQEAIASTAGRMKLIDSMEGILKGIQQKLERVQLGQEAEQKVCDALKNKYTAALSEQRECYSLLKAFQEECAKNESLRSQTSEIPPNREEISDPLLVQ